MKTKIMKNYFLFAAVMLLCSCKETRLTNNVYFEEAQPINDPELTKIPSKFIGEYFYNDSVSLNINEDNILYLSQYKVRFHKSEIDSLKDDLVYRDGKFIDKKTNVVLEDKRVGDSIEFILKDRDTIFKISNNQKVKSVKGKLILSTKDSLYWQIKMLTLDKNTITIQELSADADIEVLDSITKIKATTIADSNYIVKPSRREFIKILKLKKLGTRTSFKKHNSII